MVEECDTPKTEQWSELCVVLCCHGREEGAIGRGLA